MTALHHRQKTLFERKERKTDRMRMFSMRLLCPTSCHDQGLLVYTTRPLI